MGLSSDDPFETLSAESLRRLVGDLLQRLQSLEEQVTHFGDQLASAEVARAALQAENQERCCHVNLSAIGEGIALVGSGDVRSRFPDIKCLQPMEADG